jgi:hypothetical protein
LTGCAAAGGGCDEGPGGGTPSFPIIGRSR